MAPGKTAFPIPVNLREVIVQNAQPLTRNKGETNWVAVKKAMEFVTIEVATFPLNLADEWKQIKWSGDQGDPVLNFPNRRRFSRAASKKFHLEVTVGTSKAIVDLWIIWAKVEIKTSGMAPGNAAAFDAGMRDNTQRLGAVTFKSMISSVIDEAAGVFVDNMGASGKVAPVATLSPAGLSKAIKGGWAFKREVWSHNWADGVVADRTNSAWANDTSNPKYLRLIPDIADKIYDLDGPDLRWGARSYETYNRFRQWIEWNGERCSEYAPWHWSARWRLHKDPAKQITLNDLGATDTILPEKPHYAASP